MSKVKGLLVTCHRCGATVFLKYKKTDYFDGGFTKSDDFEEKPEGWTCKYPAEDGNGYVDLCPKCTEVFMKLLYDFYDLGRG